MASINISTGKKTIDIIRDGKNVGVICFSPADLSLLDRLREVRAKTQSLRLDTEKCGSIEDALDETARIDKELRTLIDYAFDYPCSDVVFGDGCSFSTSGGVSQLEQFLSGAMQIIETELGAEAEASSARQRKYLEKYQK